MKKWRNRKGGNMKDKRFNCYDCMYASDKCKKRDSDQYNKFLEDIEKCSFVGEVDNSLGCSWRNLGESID